MPVVDDSEVARELEWCEGVAAELKQAHERALDKNARAALAALRTATDGAAEAYRAVRSQIRKHGSRESERGFPDTARKRLVIQAGLLSLMAKRGRLELKLANDPSAMDRGEAIFDRIALGEAIVNRLTDSLVNS